MYIKLARVVVSSRSSIFFSISFSLFLTMAGDQFSKVQLYRRLLRALVKSERRSWIIQRRTDIKNEIAVLTYERMQVARQQQALARKIHPNQHLTSDSMSNAVSGDNLERKKLLRSMSELNRKVDQLKSESAGLDKDRSSFFLRDTTPFRDLITAMDPADTRMVGHIRDAVTFLVNQREYDELMELYNLSNKYTQQEKVVATAHRVGLDVPL